MKTRIFTGAVLVLLIILLTVIGFAGFLILLILINCVGLTEFYRLNKVADVKPLKAAGILFSLFILCTFSLAIRDIYLYKLLLLNIPVGFVLFISQLYRVQEQPLLNLSLTLAGVVCITLPLCFFMAVAFYPSYHNYSSKLILGYFAILWVDDSGAYLVGRSLGRHKLFERISPGKTWEGSVGGAICAISVAFLNSYIFATLSVRQWVFAAVVIVITGTYGDLFKSMWKRSAGVKDAGHILPGHGGVLDRFDSLLGSAPFVFALLTLNI